MFDIYAHSMPSSGKSISEKKDSYYVYKQAGFDTIMLYAGLDGFHGGMFNTDLDIEKACFCGSFTENSLIASEQNGLSTLVFDYRIWLLSQSDIPLYTELEKKQLICIYFGELSFLVGTKIDEDKVIFDGEIPVSYNLNGKIIKIESYVYQYSCEEELVTQLKLFTYIYMQYVSFKGLVLFDEPTGFLQVSCGIIAKAVRTFCADCYFQSCQLPEYANMFSDDINKWKDHILGWITGGNSKGNAIYSFFTFDYYPFFLDSKKEPCFLKGYLQSMQIANEIAKEKNISWQLTMQSYSYNHANGLQTLSKPMILWQVYCALSFGAKDLQWYVYKQRKDDLAVTDEGFQAILNRKEEKTEVYDWVQLANKIAHYLGKVLSDYYYVDTIIVNKENKPLPKYLELLKQSDQQMDIKVLSSYGLVIINKFASINKMSAYMILNAELPYLNKYCKFKFKFLDKNEIYAYIRQEKKKIITIDGVFEFEISPGEGIFICI